MFSMSVYISEKKSQIDMAATVVLRFKTYTQTSAIVLNYLRTMYFIKTYISKQFSGGCEIM